MVDRSQVVKHFDAFIADTFKEKPEIKKFFIMHPRKNLCLDNLCEQIALCEKRTYSITFNAETYKRTIRDVARMFCTSALAQREQSQLSEAERARQTRENTRDEYVEEAIADMKKEGLIVDRDATVKELPDNGADDEEKAPPKGLGPGGLIL